jgi:hypothetical protein
VINSRKLSICYSVGRAQYQVSDTIKILLGRADKVLYAEKELRSKKSQQPPEALTDPAPHAEEKVLPLAWWNSCNDRV